MRNMRYFSLFSGIGGFELGIQKVVPNAECVGYSEIDKYAIQIYKKHFLQHKNYGDATKINPNELPEFDLFCAGFPCQPFSIAGKRRGFNDTRGTLFFEIARILKVKRPKIIFLENVKGLLNHEKGKTFRIILQTLDELGYDIQWMVLNSKFFGVPQNRERVFIIGNIRGTSRPEVLPFKEISINDEIKMIQIGEIQIFGKKRKYETPKEINQFLKDNKGNFTLKEIAEKLNLPKTQVEHYFRTDKSRAIPPPEVWMKLKELLKFPNIYDKQVIEIYEKEYEFESSRRVYSINGIGKTLQSGGGGWGAKTGLYAVKTIEVDVSKRIKQRTTKPNQEEIIQYLNKWRKKANITINEIEKHFGNLTDGQSELELMKEHKKRHEEQGNGFGFKTRTPMEQSGALTSTKKGIDYNLIETPVIIRRLTPIECERLQGFPDNWTKYGIDENGNEVLISDTQRYKVLGNAVTVNVIEAIMQKLCKYLY